MPISVDSFGCQLNYICFHKYFISCNLTIFAINTILCTYNCARHLSLQPKYARDADPRAAARPPVPVHAVQSRTQRRAARLVRRRVPRALHRLPDRHSGALSMCPIIHTSNAPR